jgi:hypothetical protein
MKIFPVGLILLFRNNLVLDKQRDAVVVILGLKGQYHEIFERRFFSSNISPYASNSNPKIVLQKIASLPRYSSFKLPMTPLSHDSALSMAPLSHASESH